MTALLFAQARPPEPPPQPLPHPELPPVQLPELPPLSNPWLVAGAGLLIVLLVALVLWLLLRPRAAAAKPPRKPWQEALRALQALKQRSPQQPPAETGRQVSEVLRRYFLERYQIPAPFRTTREIFREGALPAGAARLQRYAPLAELWDQLAFAPLPATPAEAAALVEKALACLEEDQR